MNFRSWLGIAFILFGALVAINNSENNKPDKPDNPDVVVIDIEKPEQNVLTLTQPISNLVTDPTDRIKLALFNQEFSKRVFAYTTDNQKTNDLYVLAAEYFFQGSLRGKYPTLDKAVVSLLESSIGEENHILTEEEKLDLSKKFIALAWSLTQKR
jgi:hypothetical protein